MSRRYEFDLSGRVALVTGAGRNVGRGIALALAAHGASVAVNDVDAERAQAVVREIVDSTGAHETAAKRAVVAVADVTDREAVSSMVATIERELGPIDILVNNAGVPADFVPMQFRDMPPAEWDKFIRLNLYGVLHCVHAVVGGMCDRGWGRILTISSEAWRASTPLGISLYAAGKAAAIGFLRQLAAEVGPHGVTANALALGEMENIPMAEQLAKRYPTRRVGTPDDVAAAVVYLASREAAWITGQVLPVNGGLITA